MSELGAILAIDSVPVNPAGFLEQAIKFKQVKALKSK
jgi:hypothetical protein